MFGMTLHSDKKILRSELARTNKDQNTLVNNKVVAMGNLRFECVLCMTLLWSCNIQID